MVFTRLENLFADEDRLGFLTFPDAELSERRACASRMRTMYILLADGWPNYHAAQRQYSLVLWLYMHVSDAESAVCR